MRPRFHVKSATSFRLALLSLLLLSGCDTTTQMLPGSPKLVQLGARLYTLPDFEFFVKQSYPEVAESKDPALLSRLFDRYQDELLLAGLAEALGYRTAEDSVSTFVQQRLTTMSIHLLPPREQEQWRDTIRRRLAIAEMMREKVLRRISLPDDAVSQYYNSNEKRFRQGIYYRLHFFSNQDRAKAEAFVQALAAQKKPFIETAGAFADDKSYLVQIVVSLEALLPEFRSALASLKPGSSTRVIPIGHGQSVVYYVIYSEGVIPAETITLDEAYPIIRGRLESENADQLLKSELAQYKAKADLRIYKENLPFSYLEPRSSDTP